MLISLDGSFGNAPGIFFFVELPFGVLVAENSFGSRISRLQRTIVRLLLHGIEHILAEPHVLLVPAVQHKNVTKTDKNIT